MDIVNFVVCTKNELESFKEYWLNNHAIDSENYPLSLGEGNDGLWLEQFLIWSEGHNE